MPDFTPHQRKIIDRYYENRDEIMLTKLQEIVTELCLAEGDATCTRLWSRAEKAMGTLGIPGPLVKQILAKRDPSTLARHLRNWLDTGRRNPRKK